MLGQLSGIGVLHVRLDPPDVAERIADPPDPVAANRRRNAGVSGQPSQLSNIITTESPIRTSACPILPSGPGTRPSSCAPKAATVNSMSRAVSAEMIHGVTVPRAVRCRS